MFNLVRRGIKTSFAIPLGSDFRLKINLPSIGECWFTVDEGQTVESFLQEIQTEDPSIVETSADEPGLQFKAAIEKGPLKFKINSEEYELLKSDFHGQRENQSVLGNFATMLAMQKPTNKEELIPAAVKSLSVIGKQASAHLSYLKSQLVEVDRELAVLYEEKLKIDTKVYSRSNFMIKLGFVGISANWAFFIYTIYGVDWLGWDLMEPLTYSVGQGTFMLGVLYFLRTKQNNTYENMLIRFQNKRKEYYMREYGFDLGRLKFLEDEKIKLLSSIGLIEKRLFYDFK